MDASIKKTPRLWFENGFQYERTQGESSVSFAGFRVKSTCSDNLMHHLIFRWISYSRKDKYFEENKGNFFIWNYWELSKNIKKIKSKKYFTIIKGWYLGLYDLLYYKRRNNRYWEQPQSYDDAYWP